MTRDESGKPATLPATFSEFREQLQALAGDEGAAAELAARYVAAHMGSFPIVEGKTAHFVALERPGHLIGVAGEWVGGDARRAIMQPIGGGLLHYQHDFEPDARLDYSLATVEESYRDKLNDQKVLARLVPRRSRDPFNMRTGESGVGEPSELAMPGYARPAVTLPQPGVPLGELREEMIVSDVMKETREYAVYLPPGYDAAGDPYPSVYFHDGTDYLSMGAAPVIVDNLVAAGAIPPLVAVFVPPRRRDDEYNCDDSYVKFFDQELIPAIGEAYNVLDDPGRRAVIGPSMGGIISLYMAHALPDRFRRVGAMSSVVHGFRKATFDARTDYREPPEGFRLHLVIGSYEHCFSTDRKGKCRDLLTPVRELRDAIEPRGYTCRYVERHQGHSWGLWRDTLADALTFLFGAS